MTKKHVYYNVMRMPGGYGTQLPSIIRVRLTKVYAIHEKGYSKYRLVTGAADTTTSGSFRPLSYLMFENFLTS